MSLYPSFNNNSSNSKTNNNEILFSARVKDILLSNEQPLYKKTNGWVDVGIIEFKPLYDTIDSDNNQNLLAKPLYSNIKQFPLKEEIVLILKAPSYKLNDDPNIMEFYYIPFPINIWNNINHNSFPDIVRYNNNPKDLLFGKNFKENENVRNLLPEEGDFINEGRFGNSIRFASTNKNSNNFWSNNGENGDPILIIRNTKPKSNKDSLPWVPIYEDINNDDSSIYCTSTQEIPLELSCKNLQSFDITLSNSFNSSLQIPDANLF